MKAVLFDLDGTLLDSVPLILESFAHAYAALGLPLPDEDVLARGLGIPLRPFFRSLGKTDEEATALIDAYRAHNLAHHDARVTGFPGVVEAVGGVRARGLRTALVTSKNRLGAQRGLRAIGLAEAMDVLVSCDDVARPKPDPEPVRRALEWLGVGPAEVVFVGDSLHDLHCGHAAGVRTAAALWGPFTRDELAAGAPDFWLETPADLLRVIDGAAAREKGPGPFCI